MFRISSSKLGYDINYHKRPKKLIFYPILLSLLMLGSIWKAHDSNPWQNNFINGIQIHNQSPWFKPMAFYLSKAQFSLAILKPNSHWQHQSSILIGNIKTQFLLAIFKTQFSLATSKPNFPWQYQSPDLAGNI